MSFFTTRFTDPLDCVFGERLFAQFQKHIATKKCIKFRKALPKCGVSRESESETKKRINKKFLRTKWNPRGNPGDFIEGRALTAIGCAEGKRSVVSRATARHGGQTMELPSIGDCAICFIDEPLSFYETDDLEDMFVLNEVLYLSE